MKNDSTHYVGGNICQKCGKPYIYVGDIPLNGFVVGVEPYCTCGTEICAKCGKRYEPKECNHEEYNK